MNQPNQQKSEPKKPLDNKIYDLIVNLVKFIDNVDKKNKNYIK